MRRMIAGILSAILAVCCLAQAPQESVKDNAARDVESPQRSDRSPSATAEQAEPSARTAPSVWMQQKLKNSQQIFAGMVAGDYPLIQEAAGRLKLLNRLETFVRGRSPEYRTQLQLFQFANNEILAGAEQRNLERVTLAYNQLTISCVSCHRHLRETP